MRFPFGRGKTRKEIASVLSKFSDLYEESPIDLSRLSVDYIPSTKIPIVKSFDYAKIVWKQNNVKIPVTKGYIESDGKIDRISNGTISLSGDLNIRATYCTKLPNQEPDEKELLQRALGKRKGGKSESAIYILSVSELTKHVREVYVKNLRREFYVNNKLRSTRTEDMWNDVLCNFLQGYDIDNLKRTYKLNESESEALKILRVLWDYSQDKQSICVLQSSDNLKTFSLKKPSPVYSNEPPIEIKGDRTFVKFSQKHSKSRQKNSKQRVQKDLENCKISLYPDNMFDIMPSMPIPALIKVGNRSEIPTENPRIIKYTRMDEFEKEKIDKRTKMTRLLVGGPPYKELYINVKGSDEYRMSIKTIYGNVIANRLDYGKEFIERVLLSYGVSGIVAGWPLITLPVFTGFKYIYCALTSTPYNIQSDLAVPLSIVLDPRNAFGLIHDGAWVIVSLFVLLEDWGLVPRKTFSLKAKGNGLMKSSIISENSPLTLKEVLESYRYNKKEF